MQELFIISGAFFIGVLFYQFIKIIFSPPKILPHLYLIVEKDVNNLELLLRGFCRNCRGWQLTVIDKGEGENSLILEKLSMRYSYDLEKQLPENAEYILDIKDNVSIKDLKKQLSLLLSTRIDQRSTER